MIKILKNKERKFLNFEQVLYTQLPYEKSENLEEILFEKSCEDLNITENLNYQMSYILEENLAHIFLTLSENIDFKCDDIFAQALLFSAYKSDENICFVHFDENITCACFYQNQIFKNYKIIPNFSLKKIANQDIQDSFENVVFGQGRLEILLQKYKIKHIVFINDKFNFSKFCKEKLNTHCSLLDKSTYPELLKNIQLQKSANFIKHSPSRLNLWQKSIFIFLISFMATLIPSFFKAYDAYKFNQEKELLQTSLSQLNLQEQNLSIAIVKKEKQVQENENLLNDYKDIFKNLNEHISFDSPLENIYQLSKLLQEYNVKINNLNIHSHKIYIQAEQSSTLEKLLSEIHLSPNFTLKKKEIKNKIYHIELELRQ
ncbi:hypothetical protein [Campylobacter sp. US33a]|uniref:hypothetical protein n=1 Tax=Campylobacter sp. US33a TaxID=2498120 RepID=UPI001068CDB1|nr:hypothetical protein [Campylobacter sp. US33a]TEY03418.1 hypothetical protein ELQ16_02365 [Campylobacter sp. US33a]